MIVRRAHYRHGLHELYVPYYDALCEILPDHWQPISGLRTFEKQEQLYALGRTKPGLIVTKAMPGYSFHQYGLASDWDYFENGRYSPLKFQDSKWDEYLEACDKVGVQTLKWERPHNQLKTAIHVSELYAAYVDGGSEAVTKLLKGE